LNNSSGVVQRWDRLKGRLGIGGLGSRWSRFRGGGGQGLQTSFKIILLKIGAVLSVPLGAFPGVPLLLTFRGAACLLPVAKSRIR
jgi:hypothetical protein